MMNPETTVTLQATEVSVRVLNVGKRRATIGLIRQIPWRYWLDAEIFTPLGDPWGFVNYFPPDTPGKEGDRHVLWVNDEGLFRCVVEVRNVGVIPPDLVEGRPTPQDIDIWAPYLSAVKRGDSDKEMVASVCRDNALRWNDAMRCVMSLPQIYLVG